MSFSCHQTALSDSHCDLCTVSSLIVPLPTPCPLIFPQNHALKTFLIILLQKYKCSLFLFAGKRTVVPVHPTNPCDGAEAQLHSFLTSTWKKKVVQIRASAVFLLKQIPRAHCIEDLLVTRAGLDDWKTEHLASVAGILIRILDCSTRNIPILLTELFRLLLSLQNSPIARPSGHAF